MMEIVLSVATIIGGISAIWFFYDKYRGQRKSDIQLTTLGDLLKSIEKGEHLTNDISFVEIMDKLELSRMEIALLRKVASFPDAGMPLFEIKDLNNLILELEFQNARKKLIKRGILIEDSEFGMLSFQHKNLKEYSELFSD